MFGDQILISSVFLAGFLSFFAPCTFPLLPVYIGFMVDNSGEYKKFKIGKLVINLGSIFKSAAFVGGLATSFIVLGFGAGLVGNYINNRWVLAVAGLVVIVLGLHQAEIIHINRLENVKGINFNSNKQKVLGVYLTGLSFSLGWTPCVGPVLAAVLLASASQGTQLYGAFLMLVYSLGLMIPFLVMALASEFMVTRMKGLRKYLPVIKKVGGYLIILMGLILMSNQLGIVTAFFNNLFH